MNRSVATNRCLSREGVNSLLQWKHHRGVISSLSLKGTELILPWGVETADSSAFFSMEKGVGYRHQILSEVIESSETNRTVRLGCKMREGRWDLIVSESLEGDSVIRKANLTCLEDSWFLDYVLRYRFLKEQFARVLIAGKEIRHENSNIYHQYPVDRVQLDGRNFVVSVQVEEALCPSGMHPFLYARDRGNEWIVHARMLPENGREVVKICNGWAGTRPLPSLITKILMKFPGVKDRLMYRSEKNPNSGMVSRVMNLNAYRLIRISKGESLGWTVRTVVREIQPVQMAL